MKASLAASMLLLVLVVGGAGSALASWMVPDAPFRPKDFAFIKHDGLYHLFYIRNDSSLAAGQTENDLGHAVSRDLWNWEPRPPVLPARAGSWDSDHIWAPSIIQVDSVFFMFYTGVADSPGVYAGYQRIGVATSTDLEHWNRMDLPVRTCQDAPWAVCDSLDAGTAFRDPFVMPDPRQAGAWLLYYSATPASDSASMVVGMAGSDGNLLHWRDLGPLWITHRSFTYNAMVESPHLFQHAGLWYLFYTTDSWQALTFSTGPDPLGPPGTWTWRGRLATMLGVDTHPWFASEHLADGRVDYFAYVMTDRIEVRRIVWSKDWRFSLGQPDFMHVERMTWAVPVVHAGDSAVLSIVAANWNGQSIMLEGARQTADGTFQAVSLDSLGFPKRVDLTGDTTRVTWLARRLSGGSGPDSVLRLVVRLADATAEAPLLEVDPPLPPEVPPPVPVGWDAGTGSPIGERARDGSLRLTPERGEALVRVRALRTQPGLVVEMARAAEVRLDLFDLQGRRVRNLADRILAPGAHVLLWDGLDLAGARAPAGVYFARIATPDGARTVRLLLTR